MVRVGGLVVSEKAVREATTIPWLHLRWEALKQETVAAFRYFNLIGETWTGQVQQVTA